MVMVGVLLIEGGWGGGMILDFVDVFGGFGGWHYFILKEYFRRWAFCG